MHTLGLIGGMSWESTAAYYRLINRGIGARLGGLHSAPLLMHSLEFNEIAALQRAGQWDVAGQHMARAAVGLERLGAEALVLTSNTMHHVASAIEDAVRIPLIHIVDPVGRALEAAGIRRAGLLGTTYTMELPFWRDRMARRFGIELVTPEPEDRQLVHRVIFEELCLGVVRGGSREEFVRISDHLGRRGAEAVILGCTEIGMLLGPQDVSLPVFETTARHADAAVEFVLSEESPHQG
jgi:aspartate racemase